MSAHSSALIRFKALRCLILFSILILSPTFARADNHAESETLRTTIPSPRSVLGFTPGDDRTIADWKQITSYFAQLDSASDRVKVQTLGETTLGRPLIVAFISAPENIRNLAKYRAIQAELADPRNIKDNSARDRLIRDGKVVVVISCSIHSTEIVASQMSMQLAYELATAQDTATREILKNTILILVPSPNPDGVDIVANWYRKTLGTPFEGSDPPEIYHHYAGHDDNRDWFMINLKETKLLTRLFWKEWFPEVVYDIHQMGEASARLFIPPFFEPSNPDIAPALLEQVDFLGNKVASDLRAAGFKGILTNAVYDTWWHGGFRTAPYYHNSIGILSEAASAKLMTPANITREQLMRYRTRGLSSALSVTPNFPQPWPGGIWHPRDIMNMEMMAAHTVLSLASKKRSEYLREFYALGQRNVSSTPTAVEPLAYIISAAQGNDEAVAKLIGALIEQGVEVHRLEKELHGVLGVQVLTTANGKRRIEMIPQSTEAEEIPAGSYIIFLNQPFRADVKSLFGLQVYPDRRTAQGEAERPYDVAGWTLPLMMGVDAKALVRVNEKADQMRLTLIRDEAEVRHDLGLAQKKGSASPIANPLKQNIRLAVYKGWTGNLDEGWTRYVFDTFNIHYESLLDAEVRRGNLRAKYDVIILPSQRAKDIVEGNPSNSYPDEFTGGIGEAGVESLRRFVQSGGTLICFDASTELAIKRFNLPLRNALEGLKSSEFYCPGSILGLEVDTSSPVARGLPHDMNAYFINSSAFDVTDASRVRVVAHYAKDKLLRSGWLLGEDYLKGKVALAEVSMGRGRVILFGFRPQHRGQTWGTFPLIFNSINS